MKLLALDTSSAACSVALLIGEKVTALHTVAPMQQASLILPMIHQLLTQADLSMQDIDVIAYGCGPGSFTGIRLASAVAQGLSFAYSLPVIPISSLAALAQAVYMEHQWSPLLVAVDARMGDVYWAVYAPVAGSSYVELIGQEHLCKPNSVTIPAELQACSSKYYAIGDGWKLYQTEMSAAVALKTCMVSHEQQPTASAILALAQVKLTQGESGVTASEAMPVYLR